MAIASINAGAKSSPVSEFFPDILLQNVSRPAREALTCSHFQVWFDNLRLDDFLYKNTFVPSFRRWDPLCTTPIPKQKNDEEAPSRERSPLQSRQGRASQHRLLTLMRVEGVLHEHVDRHFENPDRVFYNEHAPFPAQWLRELCATGAIPAGRVDGRSIQEVEASDVAHYDIAHWFAGIGVWSYAVEQAGWPRNGLRTWSASLPCQPFSGAGKRRGFDDPRHLWPTFFNLVEQCEPDVIVGEQVASPNGRAWLDVVRSDLEAAGYAVAAVDTCSAGVGAPQKRQRIYWSAARVGNAAHIKRQLQSGGRPESARWQEPPGDPSSPHTFGATAGYWGDAVLHECLDGYRRPLGPGLRTLAAGSPGAVDALRGIGNALNAEVAIAFVVALREALVEFDCGRGRRTFDQGKPNLS